MNANNASKEILPFHHITQEGEINRGEEFACCGKKDTSKCLHCGQHLPESGGDMDTGSDSESTEESANDSENGEESLNKRYKWVRCSNGSYRAKCTACKKRVDECPQCHTAFEEEDEPESDEDSSSKEDSEESSSDEEPQRKRKKWRPL